jgi:putative tryptophan/tyrosine transport system substrate-binding protein
MKRRSAFLVAISLGAVLGGAPLSGAAQQPGKVFRIGVLSLAGQTSSGGLNAFREGLRDLGYIEGRNVTIEYRLAAGDFSRLPAMAGELVRLPVDIILVDGGGNVAQIAHDATPTIPIVGPIGPDPVAAGLAASFAHPGGNVTGHAGFGVELSGKRLQLLKEAVPGISRVAALWSPADPMITRRATLEAARTLGLQLRPIEVLTPDEIPAGFDAAAADGAEALVVLANAMFGNYRARIIALAAQYRMPAIYPERIYADDGGLLTYDQDMRDAFRRVATYVDKILKGANPGDLPIERPTKFALVVNLKTAKALGLTIPQSILLRADEVIE